MEQVGEPVFELLPNDSVLLSVRTPGAGIFYTLTGVDPTTTSIEYTNAPIFVPSGSTLKARAILSGYIPSQLVTYVSSGTTQPSVSKDIVPKEVDISPNFPDSEEDSEPSAKGSPILTPVHHDGTNAGAIERKSCIFKVSPL